MRFSPHFTVPAFFCSFLVFISPGLVYAQDLRAVYEQASDAYNKGDLAKAVELFTEATKMAPKFAPAYVGLGLALKSSGADFEEILYYYKTATEVDPANAPAFEQLGRLYYAVNQFDKAEVNFQKALKIDPNISNVKLSLAWLYLMSKPRPAKAVMYFKDALKTSSTPNTWFGLGMAYFSNNEREKAMDVITKLRDMDQEDLAQKLESAMREKRIVVLELPQEQPQSDPSDTGSVQPAPSAAGPLQPIGVKVRLRDKLSVLDN